MVRYSTVDFPTAMRLVLDSEKPTVPSVSCELEDTVTSDTPASGLEDDDEEDVDELVVPAPVADTEGTKSSAVQIAAEAAIAAKKTRLSLIIKDSPYSAERCCFRNCSCPFIISKISSNFKRKVGDIHYIE